MKIRLCYMVKLGKYDSNEDVFDWEVETADETIEKAVERAVMTGTEFNAVPELRALREEAYKEIEQEQLEKLRNDKEDAFAIQCFRKGQNPFENGYKLTVVFSDDEIIPDDEAIEDFLREALKANDVQLAEAVVLEQNENYSGNLLEKVFEIAEEVGCQEFIEKNKQK